MQLLLLIRLLRKAFNCSSYQFIENNPLSPRIFPSASLTSLHSSSPNNSSSGALSAYDAPGLFEALDINNAI